MSAPPNEPGAHRELAAAVITPPAPPVQQVAAAPDLGRTAAAVPAAAAGTAALQRLQNTASRSLAEVAYRIRRLVHGQ